MMYGFPAFAGKAGEGVVCVLDLCVSQCGNTSRRAMTLFSIMARVRHFLIFIGTRPEAIKLAPLVTALRASGQCQVTVCISSQHREMLQQALQWFDFTPDEDLDVAQQGQPADMADVFSGVLAGAAQLLARHQPSMVVVQGDTTTATAAALAAFYVQIPVAHIEAGLRSGNRNAPYPEETNRILISKLATWHFAPTPRAAQNLRDENSDGEIHIVGNTVLDALISTNNRIGSDATLSKHATEMLKNAGYLPSDSRRFILVTGHRRESFGAGL